MTYACLTDLYAATASASSPPPTKHGRQGCLGATPFVARKLTFREKRDLDLYTFESPKEGRRIEVIGLPAMCLALLSEFNANVAAYVERPRNLQVGENRYELSFWIRDCAGRERFLFIVPNGNSVPLNGGRRTHRMAAALHDAAAQAQMHLIFVSEPDLIDQRARISQAIRMLPYVQEAIRLPNREFLRERIRQLFEHHRQAQISQIERALAGFNSADVRAVICDLVHLGLLSIDSNVNLTMHSLVRRSDASA
jgi:hypothetical protein